MEVVRMQMAGDQREELIHAVELRKENAKELGALVKALSFRETGTLHFLKSGLRIICDDSHCEQAIAYLETPAFSFFILREESSFRVPLVELHEVLNMLDGNGVTVKMTYDGFGEPLRLQLVAEDDEYVVQANIHTLTAETLLEFEFDPQNVSFSAVFKPDILKDAIRSIDDSSPSLTIEANRNKMSFISQGDVGRVTASFPAQSDLVDRFECPSPVSHSYRLQLIKRMQTALSISTKVAIRIDHRGVLCIQFLLERQDSEIFIEFFCVADEDEE